MTGETYELQLFSMVTTIIAIYGAAVATVSTVLEAWYFLRSGPILQADANVELSGEWNDDSFILLRVWNNGRAEITVRITYLVINRGNKHLAFPLEGSDFVGGKSVESAVRIGIDGPEVPIRISGYSGEFWHIYGGFDIRSITPFMSGKLSFLLMVGGNRAVKVPVMDGTYRRMKRRFILTPVEELEPPPEVSTTRVVRQQPVRITVAVFRSVIALQLSVARGSGVAVTWCHLLPVDEGQVPVAARRAA